MNLKCFLGFHKWKRLPEEDGNNYEVYICTVCGKKEEIDYGFMHAVY